MARITSAGQSGAVLHNSTSNLPVQRRENHQVPDIMNTDTPATASDLDKALSRIGHDDPTWVIPDKIFKRKGNAKEFRIRPDDEAQLTEEAEQTGWRRCTPAWDWKAESWQTHIALQQLGVGVGHPMYLRMMSRYHTGRLVDLSKKDFAAGHNLAHLPQAARDATQFKDLVSMSMKVRPCPNPRSALACTS